MLLTTQRTSAWSHLVLFVGAYFVAGKLGLILAFLHVSASPVWPPTGLALAALLLFGIRFWPAIFLGAFLVNLTTAGSVDVGRDRHRRRRWRSRRCLNDLEAY